MAKKTKHNSDYVKNRDADVISKSSEPFIPQSAWIKDVGPSVFAKGNDRPLKNWEARPGKERPTPHVKINECDH